MELTGFHNMDCMEGMKEISDNSIDLIVTSPPYNLGSVHHTGNKKFTAYNTYNDDMPENEYQEWQKSFLNECCRIIKKDGSIFYNHKNRIRKGVQISPYSWILETKCTIKQELVWFNGSQNFDKVRFYPMTERVYWLSKTKETQFKNNINHHDLFEWKAEGTDKEHKRAFPVAMVKSILNCFPKGLVCDPFGGSGTVAIGAYDLGWEHLSFELDGDYYNMACKRLEEHKSQLSLTLDFGL